MKKKEEGKKKNFQKKREKGGKRKINCNVKERPVVKKSVFSRQGGVGIFWSNVFNE